MYDNTEKGVINNSISKKDIAFCIILCTVPNEKCANLISNVLLENRLAACVSTFKEVKSLFLWNGKIENKSEIQLLIKSNILLKDKVFEKIRNNHPYQVPEILLLLVDECDARYLSWVKSCCL